MVFEIYLMYDHYLHGINISKSKFHCFSFKERTVKLNLSVHMFICVFVDT